MDYEGGGSYIGNVSTTSKPVVENLKNVGKMVAINTINGGMDKVVSTVTATVLIPLVWDL
ncbi:hypothetical protein [Haloimpatiens massiliensis]|uniref:hypothetical protein n=1 Tax=Haloimpatiens massiliensis TaxID=1658110 RepID=UPI001FA86C31|nr:hypothetical protein [Haloimpatiens massiliensis]